MKFDPERPPSAADPLGALMTTTGKELLSEFLKSGHSERPAWVASKVRDLEGLLDVLSRSLEPAAPADIREALGALVLHYPARPLEKDQRASVLADWMLDLGRYPADIVFSACQHWRRSPNQFAPTPGHLIEFCEPVIKCRKFYHRMLWDALDGVSGRVQQKAAG